MSKYLLIPRERCEKSFFDYGFDGLILPLENYSIGFESYFSVQEINELGKKIKVYVIVNKFLHKNEIEKVREVLKDLENVEGFFVEDLGLVNILPKNKTILFQNHVINNYDAVNFLGEYGIKRVVLSNELTKEELDMIRRNSDSELYYFLINRNMLMYSKRKLVSNYYKYFGVDNKNMELFVNEKVSGKGLFVKEEGDATCIFDGNIFVGEEVGMDYYIVNINNMSEEDAEEVLNNYRGRVNLESKDNYFLYNTVGYKVK